MLELYNRRLKYYPDPETVFFNLFKSSSYSFWLDSSLALPGLSRFSFMGDNSGPLSKVFKYNLAQKKVTILYKDCSELINSSIFPYLQKELNHYQVISSGKEQSLPFYGGFVGYLGYELKAELGARESWKSGQPDAYFILADRFLCFDHLHKVLYLICLKPNGEKAQANVWFDQMETRLSKLKPLATITLSKDKCCFPHLSRGEQTYLENISQIKQYIKTGETYEVCLTNKLHYKPWIDPFLFYRLLRKNNPAPYSAFLHFNKDITIACSSPECYLKINREGWVESKPIKGTIKRAKGRKIDTELLNELKNSEKDRSENLMIVDLVRNDLGRVCETGSVYVPRLMAIESYRTVHQMVSTIRGKLEAGKSVIDCIKASFPGGSMTGAPKLRTMEIIDRLEKEARGVYSGCIGYLGFNGTADLNIVIRTAVFTRDDVLIGTGGAIVDLSDPQKELDEIMLKTEALVNVYNVCYRSSC